LAREVRHAQENQGRISPKAKISANQKKISGRQVALLRKFPISRMSKFMKNSRRDYEIRNEDFDSFFLWKVFWKLICRESPLVFFLKVFLVGAGFIVMLFFILLLETYL
jgi:hypothetical protein